MYLECFAVCDKKVLSIIFVDSISHIFYMIVEERMHDALHILSRCFLSQDTVCTWKSGYAGMIYEKWWYVNVERE